MKQRWKIIKGSMLRDKAVENKKIEMEYTEKTWE